MTLSECEILSDVFTFAYFLFFCYYTFILLVTADYVKFSCTLTLSHYHTISLSHTHMHTNTHT